MDQHRVSPWNLGSVVISPSSNLRATGIEGEICSKWPIFDGCDFITAIVACHDVVIMT
jgi:hypothetical protein